MNRLALRPVVPNNRKSRAGAVDYFLITLRSGTRDYSMDNSSNPFAAPTTIAEVDPELRKDDVPELHGRMPGSVMLAMVCVGIFVVLNAIVFLMVMGFMGADGIEVLIVGVPLLIGVLVLVGLIRRWKLARQWGRIMGMLGAILASFGVASMIFSTISFYFGTGFYGDNEIFNAPDTRRMIAWSMLTGMAFNLLPTALLWTMFFSLGRPTALAYFRIYCPQCKSRRTRPANFLYSKSRCKDCEAVW